MGKHCILVVMENMTKAYDYRETVRKGLRDYLGIEAVFRHDRPALLETPNCVIRFVWPAIGYIRDGLRPDAIFGPRGWIKALKLDTMYPNAKYPVRDYGVWLFNYIEDIELHGVIVDRGSSVSYVTNDVASPRAIFERIIKENNYMAPKTHNVISPIKNVIFNNPATIVFWADNTKTVVKCENEEFDPEKGLAMAISKKALGNQGNYFDEFKKWTKPYYDAILADMDRGVD